MSKNAEFRAIQPSQSILNYVEDNLLGRRRLIELRRAGYNINLSAPLDNIPSEKSSERMRIEENIFRNKMKFFASAKVSTSFPPPNIPEVAFAGRSNVGKSSLLNALTGQWGVARTSDKPGLTQTINFFELGSKLCLVDLPGYGFAYAKEEVKEDWEDLSYVVTLGAHSHEVKPKDVDVEKVKMSHHQFLGSVLRSKSRAQRKLHYSYAHHLNAFAAQLSDREAVKLASSLKVKGKIPIFPENSSCPFASNRGRPTAARNMTLGLMLLE